MNTDACPLCGAPGASFHRDRDRPYLRCAVCGLVFVPPQFHPAPEREKARYDLHRNDPSDPKYVRFLANLADPLAARLPAGAEGLDFGCGPTMALAKILAARGFRMEAYDPFYAPDRGALDRTYDFIACAEAVEHFFHPAREWAMFLRMIRPGGLIGIMTGMLAPDADFGRWWYRNDFTHVSFFSRHTFEWLAARDGLAVEFADPNVTLFRR